MSPLNGNDSKRTWRSIDELEQTPEFREYLDREFPEQAHASVDSDPVSRRTFVQLMGASFALAGVAGCRWEKEDIVPLSRKPEGYVPGVPSHFATAMDLGGAAAGLLVTAVDGRPIKIEGNPDHPFTGGRSTAFAQASILHLYDPDRSERVIRRVGAARIPVSWDDFYEYVEHLPGQTKFRILTEASSSPTVARLRDAALRRFSTAQWHEWEPLSLENEREGTRLAFGVPMRVLPMLDQANVVLALDSNLLVDHPASLRHARDLMRRRRPEEGPVSRFYSVESRFTASGALSDHRLPLRSELIYPFLLALEARVSGGGSQQNLPFGNDPKIVAFLDALAEDLKSERGRSVIVVGASQPPIVHALAARLNEPSAGVAVGYVPAPDPERATHTESIRQLVKDMNQGAVDMLLILGGNPALDAPAELGFSQALGKVRDSIHLSPYVDETSVNCTWHLPRAHYLEAWGDARAWDGTVSVQQPIIQPLRHGGSPIQVLASFTRQTPGTGEQHVRETLGLPEAEWRKALHDGHVPGSQLPRVQPQVNGGFTLPALTATQAKGTQVGKGEIEVVFTPSSHCYDGRFANNAWLQETPDFMTKLVWDNAALISPATAKTLDIEHGDMIEISIGDRRIQVAAYTMPGQAPFSIALALGHGRTRAGRVGGMAESTFVWKDEDWVEAMSADTPGFDVYPLRTADTMYIASGAQVSRLGSTYDLTTTQDHWALDSRGQAQIQLRLPELARTATVAEYKTAGFGFHPHGPPLKSLWDKHPELTAQTGGHRWGMATDLAACIGCNSCMVACQSENNVPIVGKEMVRKTREMHWIRIDRYFQGDVEDPRMLFQPVTCQQCEAAPCEQVCPVGATIHSDEGLNDMVYNRCVGTRYCANNCPYKVRRFNYLSWHHRSDFTNPENPKNAIRRLLFNPEVTVRSRGVMEKCTFCVQRIESAKIRAKNDDRAIRDGEFTTACAQACPTEAIVFGDLSDPNSRVSKLHKEPRRYALLAELNTSPRNLYLARILNPNGKLAGESHNEHGSH